MSIWHSITKSSLVKKLVSVNTVENYLDKAKQNLLIFVINIVGTRKQTQNRSEKEYVWIVAMLFMLPLLTQINVDAIIAKKSSEKTILKCGN